MYQLCFVSSSYPFPLGLISPQVTGLALDVAQMQTSKGKAVTALTGGIEYLFKKYGVEYLKGKGSLAGPHTVRRYTVELKPVYIIQMRRE
jgi:pyruvate/2-oxoglutarate dehydrogenase complex dihydrolipoamide dehydrogenase (E3) component